MMIDSNDEADRKIRFTTSPEEKKIIRECLESHRCVSKSKATRQSMGDRTGNISNTSTLVSPLKNNNCVNFSNDLIPSGSFEFDVAKRTMKRLPSDFDDAQEKEFKNDWGIPTWD